jgi:rhodanese-related sulfurtransferase
MVAADVLRGDMPVSHWDAADKGLLLDVRDPVELAVEQAPGALNIPLGQLLFGEFVAHDSRLLF